MKKIIPVTFICFLLSAGFVPVLADSVTVAEDCWMEQKMCNWWGCWWEKRDCEVNPEFYQGEQEWCRINCDYTQVDEFNAEDYYTKEEVDEMFDDMYHYLNCKFVKKHVVNILFWKHYRLMQRVEDIEDYISGHEAGWSEDKVGGGGISYKSAAHLIENAIDWLLGKNPYPNEEEMIVGSSIGEYCMSKQEFSAYEEKISWLEDKVSVMQDFLLVKYPQEYCNYEATKLIGMGYEKVECGGTTYFNINGGAVTISPA